MWYLHLLFTNADGVVISVTEYNTREAALDAERVIRERGWGSIKTAITYKGSKHD